MGVSRRACARWGHGGAGTSTRFNCLRLGSSSSLWGLQCKPWWPRPEPGTQHQHPRPLHANQCPPEPHLVMQWVCWKLHLKVMAMSCS